MPRLSLNSHPSRTAFEVDNFQRDLCTENINPPHEGRGRLWVCERRQGYYIEGVVKYGKKKKKKDVKKDFHSILLWKSFSSKSLGPVSDNSLQGTGG